MRAENLIKPELNESSINDTIENVKYKEQILKQVEIMKDAFKKIDKNQDNNISYIELSEFLDKNMKVKNKKKFSYK